VINNIFQAKLKALELTRQYRYGRLEKLIPVYLRTGIAVYPHQIVAAANALANPYGKGYILADETGLGKAIEAMLVIGQMFYDGKNKIAVIVPIGQVEQWRGLIADKFGLPVEMRIKNGETRNNENSETGNADEKGILLLSYEKAAELSAQLQAVPWDLAVFDEAHRLRRYYTGENKIAATLREAFDGRRKLLLTATPMQVNVMDLYGLISFINETVFPDEREFYKRYYKRPDNYAELRDRLEPYIFRTLRSQVKADVSLSERLVSTRQYRLSDREKELYKKVERYLSKPQKVAFPEMDGWELNLMMYKLLSSSVYAFTKTLSGIHARLQKIDGDGARAEAAEIKEIFLFANNMPVTAKGGEFLKALHQTLRSLKEKGFPMKAVVFTESRETKDYILGLIGNTRYNAVEFKNADDLSVFKRDNRHVLVATDAAGEGFNIEYCNAVFNFDLPWNMQKIEQRIGRCHRIGQLSDVFVFNFLCPDNLSDVRFYELVYKRTAMFGGILGASDGLIHNSQFTMHNCGLEQKVADIIATGRVAGEVQADFEELHDRFKDFADSNKKEADGLLFNSFDGKIAEKTKNYAGYIRQKCEELRAGLWEFCKYAVRPYGGADEKTKSLTITKSPFKSGNIPSVNLYLDGDHDRASLITPTNATVKQLLSLTDLDDRKSGLISFRDTGGKYSGKAGAIGLYRLQFMSDAGGCSMSVAVGFDGSGAPLTEEECFGILSLEAAEVSDRYPVHDGVKKRIEDRFAELKPGLESSAKQELDESLSAEIDRIKRETENSRAGLAAEIADLEAEIQKLKSTDGKASFGGAFGKNQQAVKLNSDLAKLKQEEFIKKAKLKNEETEKIRALTENTKLFGFCSPVFMVQFTVKNKERQNG
jgi:ERCC4-related helicase